MYFNVKMQKKMLPLYNLWDEILKQNKWVKSFNYTQVTNELQLQKKIPTCFVFDFNFVINLNFITNHMT
jgi:hypothetical protein